MAPAAKKPAAKKAAPKKAPKGDPSGEALLAAEAAGKHVNPDGVAEPTRPPSTAPVLPELEVDQKLHEELTAGAGVPQEAIDQGFIGAPPERVE